MEDFHQILPTPIEDEMKEAYVDYAMSVIVSRALPDVRDGLKPVHRRILYTMFEEHITPEKKFRKCAATVGNVLARYHPHGDASVYDAMVRLAQPFNIRYPLVWPQGNFGSVDGDSAAHMRYTEAKLARIAMETLRDIGKNTVDWRPNFDNSTQEPVVLPTVAPTLLLNGSDGIAVGMATKIPPHNLNEVVDGCVAYLDDESISIDGLMQYIKGPDFPTGAMIMGTHGIREAYHTGRGSIRVRSVMGVEEIRKNKNAIIVTEIPFQINKSRLIEKVVEAIKTKKINGISDLRDESSRKGMRIVFELNKDAIPEVVMNQLYKHSDLQTNYGVIMLALVDNVPRILTLKDVIRHFIAHRREVVTRRTQYDLDKALNRDHIVVGLLKALDHIDEIIAIIKASSNVDTARTALMDRFDFSERQAQAILDMRLQRLTGLERAKLEEEHKQLCRLIEYLQGLLSDKVKMNGVIRTELLDLKARFGDERRTQILANVGGDISVADIIADEPTVVTISHSGYVKRVPVDAYRTQRRGGRGVSATDLKDDDYLRHFLVTRTHHYLLIFTNKARVFKLRVFDIPEFSRNSKGKPFINFIRITSDERVAAVIPIANEHVTGSIIMATANGLVKRNSVTQYINVRPSGLNALVLDDSDELVSVIFSPVLPEDNAMDLDLPTEELGCEEQETEGEDCLDEVSEEGLCEDETAEALTAEEVASLSNDSGEGLILVTKMGFLVRFAENKVRCFKSRMARGVRGLRLREGDAVVGMDLASNGTGLLLVTENGFGKRTPMRLFPCKGRAIKGVRCISISQNSGMLVSACAVNDDDEIMVSTVNGTLIRTRLDQIRYMGRTATGVHIMRLAQGDRVSALARIIPEAENAPVIPPTGPTVEPEPQVLEPITMMRDAWGQRVEIAPVEESEHADIVTEASEPSAQVESESSSQTTEGEVNFRELLDNLDNDSFE